MFSEFAVARHGILSACQFFIVFRYLDLVRLTVYENFHGIVARGIIPEQHLFVIVIQIQLAVIRKFAVGGVLVGNVNEFIRYDRLEIFVALIVYKRTQRIALVHLLYTSDNIRCAHGFIYINEFAVVPQSDLTVLVFLEIPLVSILIAYGKRDAVSRFYIVHSERIDLVRIIMRVIGRKIVIELYNEIIIYKYVKVVNLRVVPNVIYDAIERADNFWYTETSTIVRIVYSHGVTCRERHPKIEAVARIVIRRAFDALYRGFCRRAMRDKRALGRGFIRFVLEIENRAVVCVVKERACAVGRVDVQTVERVLRERCGQSALKEYFRQRCTRSERALAYIFDVFADSHRRQIYTFVKRIVADIRAAVGNYNLLQQINACKRAYAYALELIAETHIADTVVKLKRLVTYGNYVFERAYIAQTARIIIVFGSVALKRFVANSFHADEPLHIILGFGIVVVPDMVATLKSRNAYRADTIRIFAIRIRRRVVGVFIRDHLFQAVRVIERAFGYLRDGSIYHNDAQRTRYIERTRKRAFVYFARALNDYTV